MKVAYKVYGKIKLSLYFISYYAIKLIILAKWVNTCDCTASEYLRPMNTCDLIDKQFLNYVVWFFVVFNYLCNILFKPLYVYFRKISH